MENQNSYFKTQEDIWKFLIKGGAITNLDDSCDAYIYLKDGRPIFKSGEDASSIPFNYPKSWRPYPPHKILSELLELKSKIEESDVTLLKKENESLKEEVKKIPKLTSGLIYYADPLSWSSYGGSEVCDRIQNSDVSDKEEKVYHRTARSGGEMARKILRELDVSF